MKPMLCGGTNIPTAKELISILRFLQEVNDEEEDAVQLCYRFIFRPGYAGLLYSCTGIE